MPKTDWTARSSPDRRRPWLPPTDPAAGETKRVAPDGATRTPLRTDSAEAKPHKHFVEPYPYTPAQRAAITKALAKSRLGDATARDIFIGAIAYDLAAFAAALAQQPAPDAAAGGTAASEPATEPAAAATPRGALTVIADHARVLADALTGLDADRRTELADHLSATDPLGRAYGASSLDALGAEIGRLATLAGAADAAQAGPGVTATAAPAAAPAPMRAIVEPPGATPSPTQLAAASEALALGFIRHAASVYEQCFDAQPEPDAAAPFAAVLQAVADATGIAIPTETDLLRQALG